MNAQSEADQNYERGYRAGYDRAMAECKPLLEALKEIAAYGDCEKEAGDLDDIAVDCVAIAKVTLSNI